MALRQLGSLVGITCLLALAFVVAPARPAAACSCVGPLSHRDGTHEVARGPIIEPHPWVEPADGGWYGAAPGQPIPRQGSSPRAFAGVSAAIGAGLVRLAGRT